MINILIMALFGLGASYVILSIARKKWLDAGVDDAKFKIKDIEDNYKEVKNINTEVVKKHKDKITKVTDL